MARDLFMLVLALLTVVAGILLAVMILRKRRERARASRSGETYYGRPAPSGRRVIDDYATAGEFEGEPPPAPDIDDDIGKICPRCGARYGSHFRVCEHDDSELAALN